MEANKHFFKSDIGKAISSGYFLFFLNNVVALFLTPYILKFVSKEEYGLYVLCSDFLAWMMFLEFGSSKVIESKAGHLLAVNNEPGILRAFNSALFFQFFMAILIVPIFYILVTTGLKNDIPNFRIIIIIFSFSAGLSVIRSIFSAMLIASRKIHIDNKIQAFINVLNYGLILLLVPYLGVWGLAGISLLVALLILLRSYKRVFYLFPYLHISPKNFSRSELKILLSQGIYFSIASIATLLITKFDSFFLGKTFGLETVAKFYISIKLFSIAEKLFSTLINNIRPYISKFYGQKSIPKIFTFYNLIIPVLIAVSFVGFSILILINETFIMHWVGKGFFIGQKFIVLFGIYTILNILSLPARIVLTSTLYKLRVHTLLRVLEGALRLSIILIFIRNTKIFVLPLSSVISSFLFGFLSLHLILKSFFKGFSISIEHNYFYLLLVTVVLVVSDEFLFDLYYTPFILFALGCMVAIHFYLYNRKRMIDFMHLLKTDG
ncbi:hypothetical protein BH11BAC3_BH11BAC3_19400 [soil metagenome]